MKLVLMRKSKIRSRSKGEAQTIKLELSSLFHGSKDAALAIT